MEIAYNGELGEGESTYGSLWEMGKDLYLSRHLYVNKIILLYSTCAIDHHSSYSVGVDSWAINEQTSSKLKQ